MNTYIQIFLNIIGVFFVFYMLGYITFLFLAATVGSSTLYEAKRRNLLKNELQNDSFIPVSILVPAYNEEVTIVETIRSLLTLDYRLYEIVVVDDGSKDETARVLIDALHLQRISRPIQYKVPCEKMIAVYESNAEKVPITLVKKRNGGKADALNMGINTARFPYFLCMDADSVLQYDSLDRIMRPILEDQNVIAVGGSVRPGNSAIIDKGHVIEYKMPKHILPFMQVLEYDRSFLAARILFDHFNGSIIISGAFGLFQKQVVILAGGYDRKTMGEDMELVVRLHEYCRENNIPYRIRYATDAICWTQVPESLNDLRKQRRRWHIGLFQSLTRHSQILANPKYGLVSFVSYFYFLLFELYSPYIEIIGVASMVVAYLVGYLNLSFMIWYLGLYVLFTAVLSLTIFLARVHTIDLPLRWRDVLRAIGLSVIEVSVLRFVLAWVRATALLGYGKGKHQWGSISRKKIDFR